MSKRLLLFFTVIDTCHVLLALKYYPESGVVSRITFESKLGCLRFLMELGTILDWKFEIRLRVSENNEIFEKWLSAFGIYLARNWGFKIQDCKCYIRMRRQDMGVSSVGFEKTDRKSYIRHLLWFAVTIN